MVKVIWKSTLQYENFMCNIYEGTKTGTYVPIASGTSVQVLGAKAAGGTASRFTGQIPHELTRF